MRYLLSFLFLIYSDFWGQMFKKGGEYVATLFSEVSDKESHKTLAFLDEGQTHMGIYSCMPRLVDVNQQSTRKGVPIFPFLERPFAAPIFFTAIFSVSLNA